MYALEGFLTRLVASPYKGKLVLKGGVLLAAYDTRRPTRDVDLQGHHLTNETEAVLEMVRDIAAINVDDGLALDAAGASAETILALRELLDGYAGQAQPQWSAWRRKHRLDDQLPQGFDAVLDVVIAFADPVLAGAVRDRVWNAARLRWESQLLSGGGFQGEVAAVGRVEEVDLVQVEPDLRRLALGHR
jgi:hypothetical protein